MSAAKALPPRVHGQRISRAELERAGVANNLRAEYICHVCRLVVNHPHPLFAPHQPSARAAGLAAPHWADAYDLVAKFLADNNLALTRAAADAELPAFAARQGCSASGGDSDAQFRELVQSSDAGQDFPGRVTAHGRRARAGAPPADARASPKKKGSPRKGRKKKAADAPAEEKPSPAKRSKGRAARKSPTPRSPAPEEQFESSPSFGDDD
jgi:hypothetical protein